MADVTIFGYHTCKIDGGWSFIRAQAPFISEPNDRQWLTQGYYFWTDSDYFAHKWGKESYGGNYAIMKCRIEVKDDLLLDLVGSTQAQQYFYQLLTKFKNKLESIDPAKKPTVQAVIAYWRKKEKENPGIGLFPFSAIKAQDNSQNSKLSFIGKKECMFIGIQRQQLCLFGGNESLIINKQLVFPENFKQRAENV